jgi:hypothetical protein
MTPALEQRSEVSIPTTGTSAIPLDQASLAQPRAGTLQHETMLKTNSNSRQGHQMDFTRIRAQFRSSAPGFHSAAAQFVSLFHHLGSIVSGIGPLKRRTT